MSQFKKIFNFLDLIMTPRFIDARERKDRILGIAIMRYIQTVNPVSSAFIARYYPDTISSATIRNILAELEQDGFLTHPHTSAGRVPTQKGYRYYVDHLMAEIQLLEAEKKRIKNEYLKQSKELETLLENVSEVISDVMNYTGIISIDGSDRDFICRGTNFIVDYPQYQDIQQISAILKALEEKDRFLEIINRKLANRIEVLIGEEINYHAIADCSLVISKFKTYRGKSGRIAVLGPTRMNYEKVISTLEYITQLISDDVM